MAQLNARYGSELHLLRMLGRHRKYFDKKVRDVTGADDVEWLDFPSDEMHLEDKKPVWDREWRRLDFLPDTDPAKAAWEHCFPMQGQGHNWDAVGRLHYGSSLEWLLVEAKANIRELFSDCKAKDSRSRQLICRTLECMISAS